MRSGSNEPNAVCVGIVSICFENPWVCSSSLIAAGSGFLPENWLLDAAPSTILTRLSRGRRPQAWQPCPPQGQLELREQIVGRLSHHGIAASAANVVTTFGASQAFDLLARIMLTPGDAVLVEDPGYFVLFEQLDRKSVV